MKKRPLNLTMYIGFAAIGVFAVLLWAYLSNQAPQMITAMVPNPAGAGVQAFRELTAADLQTIDIPADAQLDQRIITKAWWDAETRKGKLYTVTNLLPGQIIDKMAVQANATASYQIVLPDERVVGVTTDLSGAIGGTLRSGDVVTALLDSGGGLTATQAAQFAKVISIGVGANAGKGVAGTTAPVAGDGASGIQVLLAVDKNDAALAAGKNVRIVLNPFCAVVGADPREGDKQVTNPSADKAIGQIVPVKGKESGCKVTPTRLAAGGGAAAADAGN